jgi:hypothetical protein
MINSDEQTMNKRSMGNTLTKDWSNKRSMGNTLTKDWSNKRSMGNTLTKDWSVFVSEKSHQASCVITKDSLRKIVTMSKNSIDNRTDSGIIIPWELRTRVVCFSTPKMQKREIVCSNVCLLLLVPGDIRTGH